MPMHLHPPQVLTPPLLGMVDWVSYVLLGLLVLVGYAVVAAVLNAVSHRLKCQREAPPPLGPPPRPDEPAAPATPAPPAKAPIAERCPNPRCGQPVREHVRYCPYCGEDVRPGAGE